MGIFQIVLLAAGAIIFLVSFCIPAREEKLKEETRNLAAKEIKDLVAKELEAVRDRLTELSEDEMKVQIEKSERTMERISNEKIMAVNEYSDTVLEEINKNHQEVVFLYDMLKSKKESFSESCSKTDQNMKELLQQVKDSEITVREKLEEICGRQKELEEIKAYIENMKADLAAYVGQEKEKLASGYRNHIAPPQIQPAMEEEIIPPERQEVSEEREFKPFAVEKEEAIPKRARPKRVLKRPETEKAFPEKDRDVKLLLSDTMGEGVGVNNSNERILNLHREGKSNMAIAKELGLGIGEVKLVIDLYEGLR